MGSAVLNKPPSPFITFVYCFLLISFLFYIPHPIVAQDERSGKSGLQKPQPGHAPSAKPQTSKQSTFQLATLLIASMGSAVLNKPPSPFITVAYCFLLISFLFYIPHRIVAQDETSGKSGLQKPQPGHAPSAVQKDPPTQLYPKTFDVRKALNASKPVVDCGRDAAYTSCIPGSNHSLDNSSGRH
ncbi:hypothetical protein Dsin_023966 [Dipteronia sinensis]|uniref:Uncharacterized protein n=1 Tax=Dipteronia sinensis TaxID=43782 RepID=A0AAE0A5S9_9ROSI|nr:hypothetical protein Dsin_023966 [Dipteronia sinensis]